MYINVLGVGSQGLDPSLGGNTVHDASKQGQQQASFSQA